MTAAVMGLNIRINDDGTALLQAADWAAEGHLWAIPAREVSLADVRRVAEILGPDAVSGVEARIVGIRARLQSQVDQAQAVADRVTAARAALDRLEAIVAEGEEQG